MQIPAGVIAVLVLALLIGAVLTWARREEIGKHGLVSAWTVFEEYVAKVLMLVMVISATIQVSARFLLARYVTISWTEELAVLALVWLTFWAGAAVSRTQEHINLVLVYDLMPRSVQRIFLIIGELVAICVLVPIVWYGFTSAQMSDLIATVTLGAPVSIYAYAVPAVMSLMVVHSILHLIEYVRTRPPVVEAVEPNAQEHPV